MARKPPEGGADPEVDFNWPGQRRRREPGVLDMRLAARRQREQPAPQRAAPASPGSPAGSAPPAPPAAPARRPAPTAKPPATRAEPTASDARERWIMTELRRQAVTTESALRDVSDRVDQLSRT